MNQVHTENHTLYTDYCGVEESRMIDLADITNANNGSFEEEVKEVYGRDRIIKSSQSS